MGRADGVLVGASILFGVLIGAASLVVVPSICLLAQVLTGRFASGRVLLSLLLAAIGAARGSASDAAGAGPGLDVAASDAAVGVVRSMPRRTATGHQFLLDVERVRLSSGWQETGFVALVTAPGAEINTGDEVWVAWAVDRPADLQSGYRDYIRSRGADGAAYAFATEIREPGDSWLRPFVATQRSLTSALTTAAPGDSGALLAGLVTGDDSGLSRQTRGAFLTTGTSHITAVSGSNLALLVGIWGAIAGTGSWRRRWWLQAAVIGSVWGYATMVGLEPPALRAALVASLTALSVRVGRRPDPLTLVLLAAAGMAMVDPWMTRLLSFQLSVASSAALVSCLPRRAGAGVVDWARGTLTGVVSAHFATLPIVVAGFGMWAPMSIPTNLAVLPLVPPTFALAFLAGVTSLVWPELGAFFAVLASVGASWILDIVAWFSTLASPVSLGHGSEPSVLLIWLASLTMLAMVSVDSRQWSAQVLAAWSAYRSAMPLFGLSFAGGAFLLLLVLWWL